MVQSFLSLVSFVANMVVICRSLLSSLCGSDSALHHGSLTGGQRSEDTERAVDTEEDRAELRPRAYIVPRAYSLHLESP